MKKNRLPFTKTVLLTLLLSSSLSILLLALRIASTASFDYWFLAWNLFLAWLPLVFALGLRIRLFDHPLLEWKSLLLLFVWLGFLPNSFYIMSDLVHLQSSGETIVLYDIAMLASFIINGLFLGYISIYIVHSLLRPRITKNQLIGFLGLVFLGCGFAIYIGRYLRWNTWDILFNPAGILFDVSERVVNPILHFDTFVVTFVFFAVLSSTYAVVFQIAKVLADHNTHK